MPLFWRKMVISFYSSDLTMWRKRWNSGWTNIWRETSGFLSRRDVLKLHTSEANQSPGLPPASLPPSSLNHLLCCDRNHTVWRRLAVRNLSAFTIRRFWWSHTPSHKESQHFNESKECNSGGCWCMEQWSGTARCSLLQARLFISAGF